MKKIFISLVTILLAVTCIPIPTHAQEEKVNVYLFWYIGCPHCRKEIEYLQKLEGQHEDINVIRLEISESAENADLLTNLARNIDITGTSIPVTIIGNNYFEGFGSEETHGKVIESLVETAREDGYPDIVAPLLSNNTEKSPGKEGVENNPTIPEKVRLFAKDIDIRGLSLPLLTAVLALADGFNPCAMWVLLFLISLLLGMEDKKRMWTIGIFFILISGVVYFVFLTAWLNLFLVLGFVGWIRIGIGLVALAAAFQNIKEYFTNKDGTCKVVGGNDKRKKTFEKMRKYVTKDNLLLALLGVGLLAIAVNMVELVCSAGLPAVYTKILTLSSLPSWQYYLYLFLYVIIFMIDDIVIFVIAMKTLHIMGITGKYSRFSHLVGGLVMLVIGTLMIFKPELLMFG